MTRNPVFLAWCHSIFVTFVPLCGECSSVLIAFSICVDRAAPVCPSPRLVLLVPCRSAVGGPPDRQQLRPRHDHSANPAVAVPEPLVAVAQEVEHVRGRV